MDLAVDINGWPTGQAVLDTAESVVDGGLPALTIVDCVPTLLAVIDEFQGPVPIGTGRNFSTVTETRYFDGNGFPELIVPDIVPNTPLTVTVFGLTLTDALLKTDYESLGSNTLVRKRDSSSFYYADLQSAVFLTGRQNVAVTATWGYAAQVPITIAKAVACEAARRLIIAGVGGTPGVGQTIKTESSMVTIGSGEFAASTSVLTIWANQYLAVKSAYTVRQDRKARALVRRIS